MNFTKDREEIVRLRQESADAYQLLQWAKRHPDLNCQANVSVLKAYINDDELSESNLEEATSLLLANNKLAVLSPAKQQENAEQFALRVERERQASAAQAVLDRANVEAAILAEIISPSAREHERRQIQFKSTEDLQARFRELKEKKSLRSMTVSQLHDYVRAQQQAARPQPKHEIVNLSRAEILALSPQAMRALIWDKAGREKPFVRDQVNAILRGK